MIDDSSLQLMDKLKISFQKPYHLFTEQKTFPNITVYRKFLNWISGEFDLNLQDESEHLKIFFPSKQLTIKRNSAHHTSILAEIKIKSRAIHDGFKLKEKVESIYESLVKMAN